MAAITRVMVVMEWFLAIPAMVALAVGATVAGVAGAVGAAAAVKRPW